jgi:NADH-quinone oxidoreductase subunit N
MMSYMPELILIVGIALMVLFSLFINNDEEEKEKTLAISISVMATLGSLFVLITNSNRHTKIFYDFLIIDPLATMFKIIFLIATIISIWFFARSKETNDFGLDFYVQVLAVLVGMMLMVSSNNMLGLYLGLEMVSIPSYLMTGWKRKDNGPEAAIKYTIYGGAASGVMIFGMSLIYGLVGSLNLAEIANYTGFNSSNKALWIVSILFVLAGFGYKVAAAPFHHWSPDVYEGATTPVTAFFSVGPKAAGFAMMIRFFYKNVLTSSGDNVTHIFSQVPWTLIVAIIAVLTMFIGNLSALRQNSMKRMLAYSSIAHAGYMISVITVSSKMAITSILFYLVIYLFMNIGAFVMVSIVMEKNNGSDHIKHFNGLGSKNSLLAIVMAFFMFSLMGVPPFAGFIGKVYLFTALLENLTPITVWLAVFAVINSAISVYYYARVIKAMYLTNQTDDSVIDTTVDFKSILTVFAVIILVLGLYWNPLFNILSKAVVM